MCETRWMDEARYRKEKEDQLTVAHVGTRSTLLST